VRLDKSSCIKQADVILSKCGRPIAPLNTAYVDIPTSYLYQTVTQAGLNATVQSEPCVVDGDTNFILRAISGFNSIIAPYSWPSYFYRIKFPDGSYYNGNWSASIGDWAFARGSYRMVCDQEISCPPGSEFIIDLSPGANPTNAGNPQILFEGVLRYSVKSKLGKAAPPLPPRYVRNPNQNIMAPEWMTGSRNMETPAGWQDEFHMWVSPTIAVAISAGAVTPQLSVACGGLGADCDFVWNETRYTATFTGTDAPPTGTPVVKITLPDGYALTDDFVQLAEIAGPMPKPAIVPAGRSLLVDASVFSAGGTGTCSIILYLKGARRKRIA
jgi:hypothetical protein